MLSTSPLGLIYFGIVWLIEFDWFPNCGEFRMFLAVGKGCAHANDDLAPTAKILVHTKASVDFTVLGHRYTS